MSFPDYRQPLLLEIELARQIVASAQTIVPSTNGQGERLDLACALAHIAIDHVGATLLLFANDAIPSGYALMRPALETTYKCVWIAYVANDERVRDAHAGRDVYGEFKNVIRDIEAKFTETCWSKTFSRIRPHIRSLHERTHSGAEQTLRRLKALDMRMPEYDLVQLVADVRTLAGAAILVTIATAVPADVNRLNDLMIANYSFLAGTVAIK